MHADRPVRRNLAQSAARLIALALLLAVGLPGCGESPRPDLKRLYQLSSPHAEAAPVILIPGIFGTRLRDRVSGEEIWPGPWWRILFSSYPELALEIDPQTNAPLPSRLEAAGIAEQALRRDFYRPILETLTQFGGYVRSQPGTPARKGERRYYVLSYDWRQDTLQSVRELDRLVEAVRRDYADPTLRVDLVAHSMGGLIARYYLRFGTRDVLDGEPHLVSMDRADRVRKLVLLGTPNLGSVSSLHAFISGEKVGLGRISPRTLATFPSGYQLFPHPLNTWLVDIEGKPRRDDLFDPKTWERMAWSVYEPTLAAAADAAVLQRYFVYQLERARRLAWMLSVAEPVSPIRYVLFGGGCHMTPARLLVEQIEGRDRVRLRPLDIAAPRPEVRYDELMIEPGDGRVTKPSLLARETLDPGAPQSEYSFLPVDYAFFLCEDHAMLTNNINFQDNLLNVLLSGQNPLKSK
ncbi:MAG: lipase/acyltransferase domain-containing protein [Pseudomonas sp.]